MPVSQAEAEERARAYTETWCSHVPEAVASLYAEDGPVPGSMWQPESSRQPPVVTFFCPRRVGAVSSGSLFTRRTHLLSLVSIGVEAVASRRLRPSAKPATTKVVLVGDQWNRTIVRDVDPLVTVLFYHHLLFCRDPVCCQRCFAVLQSKRSVRR